MVTSKERVLAAVDRRTTDRNPITFDAESEVYDMLYDRLGLDSKEALFDRLNCDTWMILPGGFGHVSEDPQAHEKTTMWGWRTVRAHYSGGVYDELAFSPLAGRDDISDIDNHPWPADDALDFSHFPADAAAHNDRAVIGVFTYGAYFISSFMRGMEDSMMDFALRPKYTAHLYEKITERCLYYLDQLLENHGAGVDIIYMADDYCSQRGPLFSPAAFKEYVTPYLKLFADRIHKHNKKFLLHVCGAVRPLLPMIIESGVDMLEPIQIRAEGMEPSALKRDFGKDLCFYGGIDLQRILCQATPQQVSDEVKRLIDILGADGGYIIGPGHTYIQIDAPFENIIAMYDTAANYHA